MAKRYARQAPRTAPKWRNVAAKYLQNVDYHGTITAIRDFGIFVELEAGVRGLIHASQLDRGFKNDGRFSLEDQVVVQVLSVDPLNTRMHLKLVRLEEEEPVAAE